MLYSERLVVAGAGPIGLHAALCASNAGYDVTVLERGDIGAAVLRWSHVRLFTPFSMNSTSEGRVAAGESTNLPALDELLTASDYVTRYLGPLAVGSQLNGRIRTHTEVLNVGRAAAGKTQLIGRAERGESPFRILIQDSCGNEEALQCEVLLDCTGFTSRHRWIGAGGIPCTGERDVLQETDYEIADSHDPGLRSMRHAVVVGSGYSAATSVSDLHDAGVPVTWITRGDRRVPLLPVETDSLPERRALTKRANELALLPDGTVKWLPGARVMALCRRAHQLELTLSMSGSTQEVLTCDRVVCNPGFRPDTRPFEELQVHRCYATEGPIRLAAHLLGEISVDCLEQAPPGPELLKNPEPRFFILGAASYGRDSRFLLRNGLEQVEQLFGLVLHGREVPV